VYRNKAIIIGLFSFLILFSFIPTSEAELWQFIVELNMEKEAVYPGETVVVTGSVVNHAYEPTRGVEILIRAGSETTKAFTTPDGTFRGEFVNFQRIPGSYTVNAIATWYGMTGFSSAEFQVKGDATPVTALQEKLSTDEARKYLSSNESDFEKNPIGQTLFRYYHGLLDELLVEQKEAGKPNTEQIFLEQQRIIAEELTNQAIEERAPGAGTYEGYQYESYIAGLNPEIKDLVISQLEFTKNNFLNAQKIKEEIIANGGTYEEARQAYLDRLAIPKDILEQFNARYLEESEDNSEANQSSE
jgi:hypothetical protein